MSYRLSSLLSHDNCIPTSRILASKIGLLEAVMFGELCGESDYWHNNGGITEDGYFFSTVENIETKLNIKRDVQQKILKKLQEKGLVEVVKRGLPAKRYVRINEQNLENLLLENPSYSQRNFRQLDNGKTPTKETIVKETIKKEEKEIYKEKEDIYSLNTLRSLISENFDHLSDIDGFALVLQEWLEYKKERKQSYKGLKQVKLLAQKLIQLSNESASRARMIIEQSIVNNYSGIFEIKEENGTKKKKYKGIWEMLDDV